MVEVLLRGHLWLENAVIDLITAELHNPRPLNVDRMTFANKVNLVEALGLVGQNDADTLRELNKIRNRLAHDLHGEPTLDDLSRLEGGLSPFQQQLADGLCRLDDYRRPPADPDHMVRLCTTILALLVDVEWRRQNILYRKKHGPLIQAFEIGQEMVRIKGGEPKMTFDEWRTQNNIPPPPSAADLVTGV